PSLPLAPSPHHVGLPRDQDQQGRSMTAPLRILHVVAADGRRGGEIFASDLISACGTDGLDHRVAVLHDSARPDGVSFDAPTVVLGADGHILPGVRVAPRAIGALAGVIREWS